jgi:hypothetical protein
MSGLKQPRHVPRLQQINWQKDHKNTSKWIGYGLKNQAFLQKANKYPFTQNTYAIMVQKAYLRLYRALTDGKFPIWEYLLYK